MLSIREREEHTKTIYSINKKMSFLILFKQQQQFFIVMLVCLVILVVNCCLITFVKASIDRFSSRSNLFDTFSATTIRKRRKINNSKSGCLFNYNPSTISALDALQTLRGGGSIRSDCNSDGYSDGNGYGNRVDLGTTIVAIKYRNGIIIGADSRTSIGGSYVSNRYANKIHTTISSHCVIGRSGTAADTQHILYLLQQYNTNQQYLYGNICNSNQYSSRSTLSYTSPIHIASWLRKQLLSSSKKDSYSMSLIIAGYNIITNTPEIYTLTPSGAILVNDYNDNFAVAGSGSVYIIGYLDEYFISQYQQSQNQNQQQELQLEEGDAIKLCLKVINMSIRRDSSSGGIIRYSIIDKDGIRSYNSIPSSSSLSTY